MDLIDEVIQREGEAYTNHPNDKGGPTKWGITLATLSSYRKKQCTAKDVEELTRQEAKAIYSSIYAEPFSFCKDMEIHELLIDSAVNHGVGNAAKLLQRAIGVEDDGSIGPKTKMAVIAYRGSLFNAVFAERLTFYGRIVKNNPSQSVFIEGWMNRMGKLLKEAV